MVEYLQPVIFSGNNFISNVEGEYLFLIKKFIWSCRHPTVTDKEATSTFLDIMISDRIQERMHDKSMRRKDLWREIAAEMKVKGYNLGEGEEDKVNNKYKNLERAYRDYKQHMNSTGEKRKDPPAFYEKLNQLFIDKHIHHPVAIIDTSQQNDSSNDSHSFQNTIRITESTKPSTSQHEYFHEEDAVTPSHNNCSGETIKPAKSTTKPPHQSKHTLLMAKLEEIEEKEQERFLKAQKEQQMRFKKLTDLMDRHHKERQETMNALISVMKESNSKRKRPCNASESD